MRRVNRRAERGYCDEAGRSCLSIRGARHGNDMAWLEEASCSPISGLETLKQHDHDHNNTPKPPRPPPNTTTPQLAAILPTARVQEGSSRTRPPRARNQQPTLLPAKSPQKVERTSTKTPPTPAQHMGQQQQQQSLITTNLAKFAQGKQWKCQEKIDCNRRPPCIQHFSSRKPSSPRGAAPVPSPRPGGT